MTSPATVNRQACVLCGLQARIPAATTRRTPDIVAQSCHRSYGSPDPALKAPLVAARIPPAPTPAAATVPRPTPASFNVERRVSCVPSGGGVVAVVPVGGISLIVDITLLLLVAPEDR